MELRLELDIEGQPDDATCGPTCLHAIYRYYEDGIALEQVIAETASLEHGGTLAVFLACHALSRGYRASIYTYNLTMFDPTWFAPGCVLRDKLVAQAAVWPGDDRLQRATRGYLEFLHDGGKLLYEDLTAELIAGFLERGVPVLSGLSATYLFRTPREYGPKNVYDDVRGDPSGHFVVVCGYDAARQSVFVADPYREGAGGTPHRGRRYEVPLSRLVGAILLGVLSYDANLLVLEPQSEMRPGE